MIPINTISYFSLAIFSIIDVAERLETSCSDEAPPNKIAITFFFIKKPPIISNITILLQWVQILFENFLIIDDKH